MTSDAHNANSIATVEHSKPKARMLRYTGRVVCFVALGIVGCQGNGLREQYSREANCPYNKISVDDIGENRYLVSGCNSSVAYNCAGGPCKQLSSFGDEYASDAPTTNVASSSQNGPSVPTASPAKAEASLSKSKSGKSIIKMDIPLEGHAKLVLSSIPEDAAGKILIRLLQVEAEPTIGECDFGIMLDGQRIKVSPTKKARQNGVSMLTVEMPGVMLADMGVAQQVALKACDVRWVLGAAEIGRIHQFVELCEQERAWAGDGKTGPTGGRPAPSSGWPEWKVTGQCPAASLSGPELDGSALFKQLSPSVFQIEALAGDSTSQGSAVAVSPNELLTNCHVVQGSRKIILRQLKKQWVATIQRSDPKGDRCVLRVDDAKFVPVRGVRAYTDLKVGESLYTIGSPNGLELSISDGVLSGLREEGGAPLVQTTAPISPGSSGGGLFDRRGNLVGITMGAIVGRKHTNQALNFAVPADSFWQSK